jgi:hypothetical protein
MLRALGRLGDENLYWRAFFTGGKPKEWNQSLRDLLALPLSDARVLRELERRSPPERRWGGWRLESDVTLALYRRNPTAFRSFIERCADEPDAALHQAAVAAGDEEFQDFLAYRALHQFPNLAYRAFPPESALRWGTKPDPEARRQLEELAGRILSRLDRLHAAAPEEYVRHAANILSRVEAFAVGSLRQAHHTNPLWEYLAGCHHDAWRQSPEGIRELLESPSIYVQLLGLTFLSAGGPDAARRVVENLLLLRALLLGQARKNTKKNTLECLDRAARQGPEFAARIFPILEEALDLRGKRAIPERVLVSFVRARREARGQPVAVR